MEEAMTDLKVAPHQEMPPRAAIAMLTLQLRAARTEAARAAEELAKADTVAANEELRGRLDAIVADRRAQLELILDRARNDAELMLASARAEAAAIVDAAHDEVVSADAVLSPAEVVPYSAEPQRVLMLQTGPQPDNTVAVDLDTLARTIATAVADVFDERFPHLMHPQPIAATAGFLSVEALSAVATPRKPSFWRNLLHTDVVLISLTAVLSIVVLVAWMG
jgi:hypothetical protein